LELEGLSGVEASNACPAGLPLAKSDGDAVIKFVSGRLMDGNAMPPRRAANTKMIAVATKVNRLPWRR